MNTSTHDIVQNFHDKYVKPENNILDVGSYDVNGTFKDIFINNNYTGMDIREGPNVDVAVQDPYNWVEIKDESFDNVVCGSVLEHVEYPWETFKEIARVLKTGGNFCITAPTVWIEHKYPVDCYRYYPDGLVALCKWVNLTCIETDMIKAYDNEEDYDKYLPHPFTDCYCIGIKL